VQLFPAAISQSTASGQRTFTKGRIAGEWIFHGGQCNVTSNSREHCSRLQQLRWHAVNGDWMIHFAAYTAAETPNAFQWAEKPRKLPFPWGSRPHLIHGSHRPTRISPQTASRSVQPLLHSTCVLSTHRQTHRETTLRATSVAINRTYAVHLMWPNNKTTRFLWRCNSKQRYDCETLRWSAGSMGKTFWL